MCTISGVANTIMAALLMLKFSVIMPVTDEWGFAMQEVADSHGTIGANKDKTTPLARDPTIAVEEEYELARRQGTSEVLELFIRRHPDSSRAKDAQRDLEKLRSTGRTR